MMPNFNYLGKNGFPHAQNVDVYKFDNTIDYSRYDYSQMSVQVCSVPWDQGEAHIGQRALSGIGNVVHFGSAEARNKWFDDIPDDECFRWETKYKELHSSMTLRVPLPFDVACNYNYVRVTYNMFANDNSPLEYESDEGKREWFYFIREARFVSPNTSELLLLDDAWQTWIYSLDITNMILERGHAPMFAVKADEYLENPIEHCGYLLSEDINFGELQKVTKAQATVLNGENMVAVIVCSSNPLGDWGTKAGNTWKTPAGAYYNVSGVPNMFAFAVDTAQLDAFLKNANGAAPQFKQTVQCVFFCDSELLTLGATFTFCATSCRTVTGSANPISKTILTRAKGDWGYPDKYADIAKLYTYPYSAFEITDDRANTELVRIEDTAQALTMDVAANLVFPSIDIVGSIHGIGGNDASTLHFKNVTEKSFNISGRWYDHLRTWDVPTFSIVLDAAAEYDYSSHFDRMQENSDRTVQQVISNRDASTQKTNADATANTANANAQTSANASYNATETTASGNRTQENNSAANVVDNASAQTTANTAVTQAGNSAALADAHLSNRLAQAIQAWDAGMTRATANNEIDMKNASASVGAAGGVINSVAGGAISGMLGAGPIGAAAGAIGGLVSGGIGAATSLATNAIAVSATSTQAENVVSNSQSKLEETQQSNIDRTTRANTGKTQQTNAQNAAITTSAANTASTMRENASTAYSSTMGAADTMRDAQVATAGATCATAIANNQRSYNTAVSDAADVYSNEGNRIANGISQAALRAPLVYGSVSNAELSTVRPMALFANIVTESDYAIQRAGDEFLRFGYYYDKQWQFDGNWCIGDHFTFWKLRDYWSTNQIPDQFADQLRFFLLGGVTVWKKPEDIGEVSVYDNGI